MAKRLLYWIVIGYVCWIGMMAVHESGHALMGWATGGHLRRVIVPLWGFSRTDVSPNPNRIAEVWAGPLWGSLVPLLVWIIVRKPWKIWRFFAGFCLIANGSYLAVGWSMHAGDAWELVQLGVPRGILVCVGGCGVIGGLFIWHLLGERGPRIPSAAL